VALSSELSHLVPTILRHVRDITMKTLIIIVLM